MRAHARVGAFALLTAVAACRQPAAPPVAVREPSIESSDMAVVKALMDDLLRPGRPLGARLLVVDMTMAMCRPSPDAFGSRVGRCLPEAQRELASEILTGPMARALALNLPAWNATPLALAGPLGEDVIYISPTLVDSIAPGELLRSYPRGSSVIMLSAPAYPAPRVAVLFFTTASGSGAARLERQPDGGWRVTAHAGRPID